MHVCVCVVFASHHIPGLKRQELMTAFCPRKKKLSISVDGEQIGIPPFLGKWRGQWSHSPQRQPVFSDQEEYVKSQQMAFGFAMRRIFTVLNIYPAVVYDYMTICRAAKINRSQQEADWINLPSN